VCIAEHDNQMRACCASRNGDVGDCDITDLLIVWQCYLVQKKQAMHTAQTGNESPVHTGCHIEIGVVGVRGLVDRYEQIIDIGSWRSARRYFGHIKMFACLLHKILYALGTRGL